MQAFALTISVAQRPWIVDSQQPPFQLSSQVLILFILFILSKTLRFPAKTSRLNLRKSAKSVDKKLPIFRSVLPTLRIKSLEQIQNDRVFQLSQLSHPKKPTPGSPMRHNIMIHNRFYNGLAKNRSRNDKKNSRLMMGQLANAMSCLTIKTKRYKRCKASRRNYSSVRGGIFVANERTRILSSVGATSSGWSELNMPLLRSLKLSGIHVSTNMSLLRSWINPIRRCLWEPGFSEHGYVDNLRKSTDTPTP